MKKITLFIITFLLLSTPVFAEPSQWAKELVDEAESFDLVPNELRNNYQDTIKRYEYVLLALKVAEKNGIVASVSNTKPFSDITGHPYEKEIVEAYNLGIIGGYEDGTFRPNNEITREEVSALVYNAVKTINPEIEMPTSDLAFSDQNLVTGWAKPYVQFVYQNNIMSGTGKVNGLDTIDPKGFTTREQAMILLHKLNLNDSLLAKEYSPIALELLDSVRSSKELAITANHVGRNAFNLAVEIVAGDAKFVFITDTSFVIEYPDGSQILVMDSLYEKDVDLTLLDLDNILVQEDYLSMLDQVFPDHSFEFVLASLINEFKEDKTYVRNDNLSDGAFVSGYSQLNEDLIEYYIMYKRVK